MRPGPQPTSRKHHTNLMGIYFDIFPQYNILPESLTSRLTFATSAMHAYGHQWSCQLEYNPRLRKGLGLTDGEGTERLWSRLRKLIGITRQSGVSPSQMSLFVTLRIIFGSDHAAYGCLIGSPSPLVDNSVMTLGIGYNVVCALELRDKDDKLRRLWTSVISR